ncbi:MAG: DNA-3-methyladenine glycosylase I [Methylococcus sp.]
MLRRCSWAERSAVEARYHDEEWGWPVHEDRTLYEFLVLEGAQAGLSWRTILEKRAAYREAFCDFDPQAVANFDASALEALMAHPGLIRNRLKLHSAVNNARALLRVQDDVGSFDAFVWGFMEGGPLTQVFPTMKALPAQNVVSESLSRALKVRGFSFVGPVICYSFMQAVGMVNDHLDGCFRVDVPPRH